MDSFGSNRKKGRSDTALNGNGGFPGSKRLKQETESISSGTGSKSKPCTKFFSTSGCPFGESCHFLHHVPGGINSISHMTPNQTKPSFPPSRFPPTGPTPIPNGPSPAVKTRICNRYNSPEGCKFGDKCNFAHGESDLGKPIQSNHFPVPPMPGQLDPTGPAAASSFGASATAKISVDASLAGAIIGKGGVNSKQICRHTGAKLAIRDHETDPNLRNIELEGTFDQIKQASAMVRELILNLGLAGTPASTGTGAGPMRNNHTGAAGMGSANNFKTKLCEKFAAGSCTFGERCHFAHGAGELRKLGM